METLKKNTPVTVDVDSQKLWNHTGILLEQGELYDFEVIGDQRWIDGSTGPCPKVCNADGFKFWVMDMFSYLKRSRENLWFTLMGAYEEDEKSYFKIGVKHKGYRATANGELTCFANDDPKEKHMKNNYGVLKLTVTKIG